MQLDRTSLLFAKERGRADAMQTPIICVNKVQGRNDVAQKHVGSQAVPHPLTAAQHLTTMPQPFFQGDNTHLNANVINFVAGSQFNYENQGLQSLSFHQLA